MKQLKIFREFWNVIAVFGWPCPTRLGVCLAQWVLRGTQVKRTQIQKSSGASRLNIVEARKLDLNSVARFQDWPTTGKYFGSLCESKICLEWAWLIWLPLPREVCTVHRVLVRITFSKFQRKKLSCYCSSDMILHKKVKYCKFCLQRKESLLCLFRHKHCYTLP